jgi:hypothetical protein
LQFHRQLTAGRERPLLGTRFSADRPRLAAGAVQNESPAYGFNRLVENGPGCPRPSLM